MKLSRRSFVTLVAAALAAGRNSAALAGGSSGPCRRCIWLWLNGGPSHIDTFDPKSGSKTAGPSRSRSTRAPEIALSEHLPRLGDIADLLCIVRSMQSREGSHERAQYLAHTGFALNASVDHPSIGAWIANDDHAERSELPAFVSIAGPSAGGGFLGAEYAPFLVADAARTPEDLALPAGISRERFNRRIALLHEIDASFATRTAGPQAAARASIYDQASLLVQSPKLAAFELAEEPSAVRESYGDNPFGRGCLLGRRLLERGVRFVEVTLDGWDTHQNNFERTAAQMRVLDPAAASLISDLAVRGLLDSTLVVISGEFGRTPSINANDGRDHHPAAWSAVLAGGGVRGGIVHGATDSEGERVVRDPVSIPDLLATVVALFGLDPARTVTTPSGRPISITDGGTPVRAILRG